MMADLQISPLEARPRVELGWADLQSHMRHRGTMLLALRTCRM